MNKNVKSIRLTSPWWTIPAAGSTSPSADNTYDLGTALLRWRYLYGNDVMLKDVAAATTGSVIDFYKGRGTIAAPTAITTGDDLGSINAYACVANGEWVQSAQILFDSTGTIATTRGPGTITLKTGLNAAPSTLTTALIIDSAQKSTFYGHVQLGLNFTQLADNADFGTGADPNAVFSWRTQDANANCLVMKMPEGGATDVPVWVIGDTTIWSVDYGLFDGVTQPTIAMIEKNGKYAAVSNATSTAANATLTTATAGTFTNAVVGDIVRVSAGTNATAGWYWITTVTSAVEVVLDRTWCTDAVTGGTIVVYHDFTMLSADGICTRITDGAPSDSSVEVDRDGWIILDVGQANGRLYWRANNAWHYVDATAGLSLPASERVDPKGKEFRIGDEVKLIVDRINDDGSFHAMPYRRN